MTHEEIIAYATERGLKNARLVNLNPFFGWDLVGDGLDDKGWPLVWKICEELGMSWGCGGSSYHQCKPELARRPEHPQTS